MMLIFHYSNYFKKIRLTIMYFIIGGRWALRRRGINVRQCFSYMRCFNFSAIV